MSIGQPSTLSRIAFCYVTNPRGTRMSRVRRFFDKDTHTPEGSTFLRENARRWEVSHAPRLAYFHYFHEMGALYPLHDENSREFFTFER